MGHVIHRYYPPVNCNVSNSDVKNEDIYNIQLNDIYYNYKCIWTPNKISYFINNSLMHEVQNTGQEWYPSLHLDLVLSQQIITASNISGQFTIVTPQTTYFDSVRVKRFFATPVITCPNLICTSTTAALGVDPSASNFTWSLTPTSLFSGNKTGTGKTAAITAATGASGQGKITYTFKMPSNETFTAEKTFWVGKPNNAQIDMMVMFGQSPYNILCTNTEQIIAASHPNVQQQGIDYFYWDFGSWAPYHTGYDMGGPAPNSRPTFYLSRYPSSSQVIKAAAHNQCGHDVSMINAKSKTFYAQNCFGYFLAFSPNPAGDETTLTIESDSKEVIFDETTEWELEVFDQVQTLKEKKTKLKGKEHKIQTAGWKEGVYFVRVKYKDEILTSQLVVKQ